MSGFFSALALLTRIPVPSPYTERPATNPLWFPVVGLLVGLILGGVFLVAQIVLPISLAVLVMIAFGVCLTGGMHEDGLADVADSLGGMTVERRREILKDSRVGSFGVIALVLYFAFKWQALTLIFSNGSISAFLVMILWGGWSRWVPLPVLRKIPFLFSAGKGLGEELQKPGFLLLLAQWGGLLVLTGSWISWEAALLGGLGSLALAHVVAPRFFRRTFEGMNGDGCGATTTFGELIFLTAVLISCSSK